MKGIDNIPLETGKEDKGKGFTQPSQTQTTVQYGTSQRPWKKCVKCGELHSFAELCDRTPVTCFTCGGKGHKWKRCPMEREQNNALQGNHASIVLMASTHGGPYQTEKGKALASSSATPRASSRVYALTQEEVDVTPVAV